MLSTVNLDAAQSAWCSLQAKLQSFGFDGKYVTTRIRRTLNVGSVTG